MDIYNQIKNDDLFIKSNKYDVNEVLFIIKSLKKSCNILSFDESFLNICKLYYKYINKDYNIDIIKNSNINNIFLNTKYDLIFFDCNQNYIDISENILNCIRLCHSKTVLVFQNTNDVKNCLKFNKNIFKSMVFIDTLIICKIKEEIILKYNKNLPTMVTSLYDIRKRENNDAYKHGVKNMEKYFNEGRNLLNLEIPMIIYTEEDLLQELKKIRPVHLHNITKFIVIPFEDTYFYKYQDKLEENFGKYNVINRGTTKNTSLYYILTNNKFDFMDKSINENYFNSDHFIWIDFGITHVAKGINSIRRWIYNIPDKIRQLEINPFIEDIEYKEYFKTINHNMAGGLFSGNKENLKKYIKLYCDKFDNILNDNWHQLDEAIMAIIKKENTNLFDNYYGAYDNIINGYDIYFKLDNNFSYDKIMGCIKYLLNKNQHNICYHMLKYIMSYSIYSDVKYDYINQFIICNYYVSTGRILDDEIINSITTLPLNLKFIQSIESNINYYNNKNFIKY
jgi:hypothetical protein